MPAIAQILGDADRVAGRTTASSDPPASVTTVLFVSPQLPKPSATNQNSDSPSDVSRSPLVVSAVVVGVVLMLLLMSSGSHCFRCNARNRGGRMGRDGLSATMGTLQRPYQQHYQKKLMSMNEVHDRFPMTKYGVWVATRVRHGLPAVGGVNSTAGQLAAIRASESLAMDRLSTEEHRMLAAARPAPGATIESDRKENCAETTLHFQHRGYAGLASGTHEEMAGILQSIPRGNDFDDVEIDACLPGQCLDDTGDACAICIEIFESDDDVRGLTCGHVFHGACVDPWLTDRCACCPICKADFFMPTVRRRTEAQDNVANNPSFDPRHNRRLNLPGSPRPAWLRGGGLKSWCHRAIFSRVGAPGNDDMAMTQAHIQSQHGTGRPAQRAASDHHGDLLKTPDIGTVKQNTGATTWGMATTMWVHDIPIRGHTDAICIQAGSEQHLGAVSLRMASDENLDGDI
ncbi:hypothetical protein Purlil1_12080 [Purpureocillium lilacinum]|uniref:RING-type domain-containing protein n=1 Tax=Purpureocillium lilacinum TaxID=33203 RepID=A0ABR0BIZ2_PURLI|nr:hypothetical protein Purlil1_12080 [Purpureocillium lilacinum]